MTLVPISACLIFKAAKGDAEAYESLLRAMRTNARFGSITKSSCSCQPPCEPATQEQLNLLNKNICADLKNPSRRVEEPKEEPPDDED
jgi:hypothetical protein